MACLSTIITHVQPMALSVQPIVAVVLSVAQGASQPVLSVAPSAQARLAVTPSTQVAATFVPVTQAHLTIGEVCTSTGGTIIVLASTDGPLRTRDGGFLLLDPATNP